MEANNMAAMREALLAIKNVADIDMRHHVSMSESDSTSIRAWSNLFVSLASQALSAPARNCDVGTAKEQDERFRDFCPRYTAGGVSDCEGCKLSGTPCAECAIAWAQMPYAAEEGGTK